MMFVIGRCTNFSSGDYAYWELIIGTHHRVTGNSGINLIIDSAFFMNLRVVMFPANEEDYIAKLDMITKLVALAALSRGFRSLRLPEIEDRPKMA